MGTEIFPFVFSPPPILPRRRQAHPSSHNRRRRDIRKPRRAGPPCGLKAKTKISRARVKIEYDVSFSPTGKEHDRVHLPSTERFKQFKASPFEAISANQSSTKNGVSIGRR